MLRMSSPLPPETTSEATYESSSNWFSNSSPNCSERNAMTFSTHPGSMMLKPFLKVLHVLMFSPSTLKFPLRPNCEPMLLPPIFFKWPPFSKENTMLSLCLRTIAFFSVSNDTAFTPFLLSLLTGGNRQPPVSRMAN